MRDTFKSEDYFKIFINEQKGNIIFFKKAIENKEVVPERIISVKESIYNAKYNVFIAQYSIGKALDELRSLYLELLYEMPEYWDSESSSVKVFEMMSLAIMFEVSKDEFSILSDMVEKVTGRIDDLNNDALINFYRKYIFEEKIPKIKGNFSHGYPYTKLEEIINNVDKRVEKIKSYLEKDWYIGHREQAWYNSHNNKLIVYRGYWSFESGAIAKILNIDDESLKDVKYYPYDLVHYNK